MKYTLNYIQSEDYKYAYLEKQSKQKLEVYLMNKLCCILYFLSFFVKEMIKT